MSYQKWCLFFLLFFTIFSVHADDQKDGIEKAGDFLSVSIPALAGGMLVYYQDWKGFLPYAASGIATGVTVQTLKYLIDEKRPSQNGEHTREDDHKSFPSGHAASAFWGAGFIHARYGFKKAVFPYLAASFVAYSRVYADAHHVTDVIVGAAIGTGFALLFTKPYEPPVLITPVVNKDYYGVEFQLN